MVLTALALALVPACSKKSADTGPQAVWGQTVRGKVTYKNEPVPYGYVLFFVHGKSFDPKSGKAVPAASAEIRNGRYEATNVPTGPVTVCVACDPDVNAAELLKPNSAGMGIPAGGQGGQPLPPQGGMQGGGGPPKPPNAGGVQGGPPLPPHGGMQGGPPMPPLPPHGGPVPPMPPPNPDLKNLTDAQKKTLKEIHEKFGSFGKSPLAYVVREGEQTHDINLK
jgi:hypothetical protein